MVGGLAHGVLVAGGTAMPPTDPLKGVSFTQTSWVSKSIISLKVCVGKGGDREAFDDLVTGGGDGGSGGGFGCGVGTGNR